MSLFSGFFEDSQGDRRCRRWCYPERSLVRGILKADELDWSEILLALQARSLSVKLV